VNKSIQLKSAFFLKLESIALITSYASTKWHNN